jgi:subtilisin family serine protease
MKKIIALLFLQVALAQTQGPIRVYSLDSGGAPANPSRVIVRFRAGTSFLPGSGASHALGAGNVHVVNNPPGLSVAATLARYQANPNVVYAEPDYFLHTTTTPTDPMWSTQWDMVKINAPGAWNTQTNASDVIVAVIDTGVDFTHPDLQANLWVNPADGSHGFTCMNGACVHGGQDDYGHGTHVAGTIGATADNGAGIAGINWRTQILACKFLGADGSGSDSDAVLCFNQILALKQQGFNIRMTSNSWGGGGFSQALKDAMSAVESAGILNVCAAGNSAVNADLAPMYPAGYDNRGIVSVLASDQNDLGAYFTNYGLANVDIAAPGVSTVSTVPNGTCPLCDPSGYRSLSGTSMATPHVSAVAVAMFHLNPALTANQARDVLLDPASYDLLTDSIGSMTSTGGRLNFQKVIANPLLSSPKLNNFPVVTGVSNVVANAGDTVSLTATASDPDNDPLRMVWSSSVPNQSSLWLMGWMLNTIFPAPTGTSLSFQAPPLARTAMAPYAVSVSDGRGGGVTAQAYATILPTTAAGQPPAGSLTVSPTTGPVGTVVTVNYPVIDPEGGSTGWDLWQSGVGAFGRCCLTGTSFSFPLNSAGAYRISTQAIDNQLNFSGRQSAVVRIGGATGTPPIASATFDTLAGAAPLTVNIDMSGSTDPDGTIRTYTIICDYATGGVGYAGPRASCTYSAPGSYWIMLEVTDNDGLIDLLSAYAVVTPPGSSPAPPPPGPSKTSASVVLSNMTQPYTGGALTPAAATNPPGLAIAWTNAPQTKAGGYTVTATVNDANYQGSASGTFTISKAAASVALSNMTQTYTGGALMPAATTNPPTLAIAWTNAPQTKAGGYAVTATVSDPNYQGSASGTFTIGKAAASVALSNMTQTYTGGALTPAATTNPPGLAIAWTNAPQTPVGGYPVTATVTDPNCQGSASGTFTILTAPRSATPPTVSISSPSGGTVQVKSTVAILAVASPGTNPIARVDFLINGSVKCSDASGPYTCSWNVPNSPGKTYQLQAKAYDSTGQAGASSIVTVTSSR